MENVVISRLRSVQFGEVQKFRNVAILPMMAPDGGVQYKTLDQALRAGELTVTEVSSTGSVPELLVVNRGQLPVLLIDGEELAGAKQNRVLNTTVLIKELSETRIPVSCTEQGRWSYASSSFAASGNVMAQKIRAMKSRSVSRSLEAASSYQSNQAEVWHGIAELQAKALCESPTSAMNDVFKARENDLRASADIFRSVPGQVGMFAFEDGRPAGFDLLSLSSAYGSVHLKLVRSYTLESLLGAPHQQPVERDFAGKARSILDQVATMEERCFASIGCGTDCRYRSERLGGAALVHADEVIHCAFFPSGGPVWLAEQGMASFHNRRRRHCQ